MSPPGAPHDDRPPGGGAHTAGRGTPVAVDTSGDPRARGTMALFLAGPVIWTAHFLLVYLVVEAGCTGDGPGLRLFDPPVPTVVTLAATAVATVACLGAAVLAYRRWQTDRRREPGALDAADRAHGAALAFGGFAMALLGAVTVLFVGLPALVLPAC